MIELQRNYNVVSFTFQKRDCSRQLSDREGYQKTIEIYSERDPEEMIGL